MVVGVPEMIQLALFLAVFACSLRNWIATWRRCRDGQPAVPAAPGDTVPWGLVDLGAILLFLMVIIGLGDVGSRRWAGVAAAAPLDELSPGDQAIVFATFGVNSLVATMVSFFWIHLRLGATPAQLGLSRKRLGEDIGLGVRWFTMLIVPVLALQVLLTTYWKPTQHPLIKMLRQSGNASYLPVAAFTAIVSAPVFEESLFRLFLQGWLEKLQITVRRDRLGLASKQDRDAVWLGGATSDQLESEGGQTTVRDMSAERHRPTAHTDRSAGGQDPHGRRPAAGAAASGVESGGRGILWTPMLVSSALFSLLHVSHGPDWLPLFLLGLGLGYLYQRTRRIQACIVVHGLVNAFAILQLWSAMRRPT